MDEHTHDFAHENPGNPAQGAPAPGATSAESPNVLKSPANATTPTVRFKLDGVVKSLHTPVRGTDLHRIAGQPGTLKLNGKEIPNNSETVDVQEDQEFTTR